ncbi:MAG: IS982 family transposase [Candidatus Dormibacteraceae bacterium]
MDFTELFVEVDDFWLGFAAAYQDRLLGDGVCRRRRDGRLAVSEIMTILIAFQTSGYRDFKHFYAYLLGHHRHDFPGLVSYSRFVSWIPRAILPLLACLMHTGRGPVTGLSYIDSTPLKVCGPKRMTRHRVFRGIAQRGRNTMGWFYGFKLHLVINERGELLAFHLTPGNVDDHKPVPRLTRDLWGKLFADKGYISRALFEELYRRGLKLITGVRKGMINKLMDLRDKLLLRKRSLIETVNDHLKNVCQIEHTRHRSPANFLAHLLAGLLAYAKLPKKPSLRFSDIDRCRLLNA